MNDQALALRSGPTGISRAPAFRFVPSTLGEAREMALIIAGSALCPDAYRNKPSDVLIAYEHGAALGLSWMQALTNIAVINGRPGIYGDLIPALILATGECERFHSPMPADGEEEAVCTIRRKGYPDDFVGRFSIADAKKAGLWDKKGPWNNYPKRMLQMRARAFAARDAFPDKLMGLGVVEELMDYQTVEGTVVSSEAVPDIFEQVPEALRDNLEKAFEVIHLTQGMRRAKLNEFLKAEGVTPEEGTENLLNWCRDEFAKQKTGVPRAKKGEGNGKQTVSKPPQSAPANDRRMEPSGMDTHSADSDAESAGSAAVQSVPATKAATPAKAVKATTPELF